MAAGGLGKNRSNDKARPGSNGASNHRPIKRLRSFRVNGPLLRSLRQARGWTQQDAADKSGMTDRFIRKAENGQPLELKSVSLLAQLYSTPAAPLTLEHLLTEPLGDLFPLLPSEDGRGEPYRSPHAPREGIHHAERDAYDSEALVRRWFEEVWNQGRLETIDELIAPDCVLRAEGAMIRGPAAVRRRTEAIRAAFSDFDLRMEHVTVYEDWVVARWRVAMTHTGGWMGSPPTGQRVAAHGSTWIRVADGIFVEGWDYWEQQQTTDAVRSRKKRSARSSRTHESSGHGNARHRRTRESSGQGK